MSTLRAFLTIILAIITMALSGQVASLSTTPITTNESASINKTMYYIYIIESKNHKELFPKLYPIGFVIKEKDAKAKKTTYLLGEFETMPEAEEALKQVITSGYKDAKIISR